MLFLATLAILRRQNGAAVVSECREVTEVETLPSPFGGGLMISLTIG
tara:strand:- start:710 stop:850 length:141 start_codon:yes stop_codon:yes gene_type:complete